MPMKRAPLQRKTSLSATKPMRKRKAKSSPMRRSAKGRDCTLRLPGCQNDTETVVLCHLRMLGGGGMGIKPPDNEAIFACDHCHSILDGRRDLIPELADALNWEAILRALVKTQRLMIADGLMTMKGAA